MRSRTPHWRFCWWLGSFSIEIRSKLKKGRSLKQLISWTQLVISKIETLIIFFAVCNLPTKVWECLLIKFYSCSMILTTRRNYSTFGGNPSSMPINLPSNRTNTHAGYSLLSVRCTQLPFHSLRNTQSINLTSVNCSSISSNNVTRSLKHSLPLNKKTIIKI